MCVEKKWNEDVEGRTFDSKEDPVDGGMEKEGNCRGVGILQKISGGVSEALVVKDGATYLSPTNVIIGEAVIRHNTYLKESFPNSWLPLLHFWLKRHYLLHPFVRLIHRPPIPPRFPTHKFNDQSIILTVYNNIIDNKTMRLRISSTLRIQGWRECKTQRSSSFRRRGCGLLSWSLRLRRRSVERERWGRCRRGQHRRLLSCWCWGCRRVSHRVQGATRCNSGTVSQREDNLLCRRQLRCSRRRRCLVPSLHCAWMCSWEL